MSDILSIKSMVKGKKVKFLVFKDSEFWYETECGFKFPVPISDIGNAQMLNEDKAILFMRWINKQIKAEQEYEKQMYTVSES